MPTISYAITACNEHVELDRLLNEILIRFFRIDKFESINI